MLRPIPVKIWEVVALSCTKAGSERGSEAANRYRRANVNAGTTEGRVPISVRSWSSAARQSTRATEIAGLLNSSAADAFAPATSKKKASCRRAMNVLAPDSTVTPPGAFPVL